MAAKLDALRRYTNVEDRDFKASDLGDTVNELFVSCFNDLVRLLLTDETALAA
jgi:hypothetical protein